MWELGPVEKEVKLDKALRKVKETLQVQRQDHEKPSSSVSKVGEEPLKCKVFLKTMKKACPYFKDQIENADATLYGEPFKDYVCKVLDKFQGLYKTCKHDRLALQILLAMRLSAQERVQCRAIKDANGKSESDGAKKLKRWQGHELAAKHLRAHLQDIEDQFGKTVRDIVERPAWLRALAMEDIELFMKGFKHPTLMAIELLNGSNASDARETLEVGIIVHHALTAARPRGDVKKHWACKASSFIPKEALGFVSGEHFEALYGDVDDAQAFTEDTQKKIDSLWKVLDDSADPKNVLPSHPRFADAHVGSSVLLDAVEKDYLRYLPVFDHPESEKDNRSECEAVVRDRVEKTLKKYLAHYGPDVWYRPPDLEMTWKKKAEQKGTTKTLTILEKQRGASLVISFEKDIVHAKKELVATEKNKIKPFLQGLLVPTDLRNNHCRLEIEIEGEEGNDRRKARRKAVEDAVKEAFDAEKKPFSWRIGFVDDAGAAEGAPPIQAFLDTLCSRMWDHFCVDQAFDCGVSTMIVNNAKTDATFTPKAWFPLKTKDLDLTEVFPDCGGGGVTIETIEDHYEDTGGSSPRPAHYMDWRNHKDLWLYDCFHIARRRRPVFGSLSVQPFLPAPNPNYGGHILYYKRPEIRQRTVFTFGDKQQPRRSMLLVLDTILHGRTKKDGGSAQKVAARQKVIFELLRRHDVIELHGGKTLEELWKKTFEGEKVPYPEGDLLIECQIFGGIDLLRDGSAFVPAIEDEDAVYYIKSQHLKTADLNATLGKLNTVYPGMTILPYTPSAIPARPNAKSGDAGWEGDLSEIDE